jgi:GNAT superfamily N-acetyltransferase
MLQHRFGATAGEIYCLRMMCHSVQRSFVDAPDYAKFEHEKYRSPKCYRNHNRGSDARRGHGVDVSRARASTSSVISSTLARRRQTDAQIGDWCPVAVTTQRGALCREILTSLPEWFGRPASVDAYVEDADGLPMLACFGKDGVVASFLSLKVQTDAATKVLVMGVKPHWHRRGIGRALMEAAAARAAFSRRDLPYSQNARPYASQPSLCSHAKVLRDMRI